MILKGMMLKKLLLIFSLIIFSMNSYAGERKSAGTVLEEDSMVFTIQESQDMASYISSLEEKIALSEEKTKEYKKLDNINMQKIERINENLIFANEHISRQNSWLERDEIRMKKLDKRLKGKKIENALYFGAGVLIVFGTMELDRAIYTRYQTRLLADMNNN